MPRFSLSILGSYRASTDSGFCRLILSVIRLERSLVMSLTQSAELVWGEGIRRAGQSSRGYDAIRDRLERGLGLLLLLLALPVIALLVAIIRITSPGPGIYRQRRVGLGGCIFTMYKLRSMRNDAESRSGPVWAGIVRDARVTPLGAWLRHLHLDELPQLFNVACGEMALVGPRPERPEFVDLLAEQIPGYLDRLKVKPGITGLAQINLPPDSDLQSVRRKLVLDQEYLRSSGILFDARIILCTALQVLGLRGGRAVSLMGLSRTVELPAAPAPAADSSPPVAFNDAPQSEGHLRPLASPAPLVAARG